MSRIWDRPAARSGALWGLVFGLYVTASASGYATTYPTLAARQHLATTIGTNAGIAAIVGPARHIETVAGFTAWRCMGVLTIVGAVWALFLATRLTRGDEDLGRWEIVLSGPTTRGRTTMRAVAAVGTGVASLWVVTTLLTLANGASAKVAFSAGGSVSLGLSLVAGAAMWAAVGVLCAQLAATRRQANGIGALLLGIAFLVRMSADAAPSLHWLRWTTPLGWAEQLHPLTGFRPVVFVPIAALTAAATVGAVRVAAGRDLGASVLPARDTPAPRVGLLTGSGGLAVRLVEGIAIAWLIGVVVLGTVLGLVAQAASSAMSGSKTLEDAMARIGGRRFGSSLYLGVALLIAAALVAFLAASQVGAARTEEAEGHLDHVLSRSVARSRWLAGRLGVAACLVLAAGVATGVAAWVGAAVQNTGLGFGSLTQAGLNTVPPAMFVIGFGALAVAVMPRRAAMLTYALVSWSLLVELLASVVKTNRLVLDTSILSHIRPAPAANPNWSSDLALVALGVVMAAAALLAFARRDLVGE